MDNFLTFLYKEFFNAQADVHKYATMHDFKTPEDNIRNDEKIDCSRKRLALMVQIIEHYENHKINFQ